MSIKITAETTSFGKGKLFDIYFYGIFAVIFYIFALSHLVEGKIVWFVIMLAVALLDTVIAIANIKKRKELKK